MRVIFEFDPTQAIAQELVKHIDGFRAVITRWGPDFINPSGRLQIEAFLRDIDPRRASLDVEEDT